MKRDLFLIFLLTILSAEYAVTAAGPATTTPSAYVVSAAALSTTAPPAYVASDAALSTTASPTSVVNAAACPAPTLSVFTCNAPQDSIGKQLLYNGRVWRNLYQHIEGTQFLLSSDFLPGSVVMNGRKFNNPGIKLKLDLVNDELLLLSDNSATLRLNKQMVEQFTLEYDKRLLQFINLENDSLNDLSGYVNVIYNGKTALYVKYKKEVRLRDTQGEKDTFTQSQRIYLMKEGKAFQVNNRKKLVRLLGDQKEQVRDFIRTNRIRISRNHPESFAPVLEYYDSLK